jgi:hypothetical protein
MKLFGWHLRDCARFGGGKDAVKDDEWRIVRENEKRLKKEVNIWVLDGIWRKTVTKLEGNWGKEMVVDGTWDTVAERWEVDL